MSSYFPGNRPTSERTRDAYGNYIPGNIRPVSERVHWGDGTSHTHVSPPCDLHSAAIRVTESPMLVTAGSAVTPIPLGAVHLDLTGNSRRTPEVTGLPGLKPVIVRVRWQDMSVPALSADDWTVIADRLRALKRPVHVACMGGRGRTGTALAILLSRWGVIPADSDPVTWVRTHYCDKAIETEAQAAYARRMTGYRAVQP